MEFGPQTQPLSLRYFLAGTLGSAAHLWQHSVFWNIVIDLVPHGLNLDFFFLLQYLSLAYNSNI